MTILKSRNQREKEHQQKSSHIHVPSFQSQPHYQLESKDFPMGPCSGRLLDSGGVILGAPVLYVVYNWYLRIPDWGPALEAHGMDSRWQLLIAFALPHTDPNKLPTRSLTYPWDPSI